MGRILASSHVSKGQLTITKSGVTRTWDIHRDSNTSFYLTEPGKTWPEVLMTRPPLENIGRILTTLARERT